MRPTLAILERHQTGKQKGARHPDGCLPTRERRSSCFSVAPCAWALAERFVGESFSHASQCHHNCVMTKHPGYSSATLWHQDIRYWSFDRPELISAWFALGQEAAVNGALQVIPESHVQEIDRGRLDSALFLRPELAENQPMIERAEAVNLKPGDLLLFHCRLFHAAGQNQSRTGQIVAGVHLSRADNQPIPGTRSERLPSIPLVGPE
ncbi:MAG: hypothetical protein CM15mP120_26930 [Pseudomonadota bacterium]|nr:MAG: hypothetical protein CM15mP120_26930 [Pseudomonadota bacterium]